MSHFYPEDQSAKTIDKIRRENHCAECGRQLSAYFDMKTKLTYIACSGQVHEGIVREYKPQATDYQSNIRRKIELENEHGRETATALATLPKHGRLTQPQAEHILSLVYPDVPRDEVIRCAILCRDFGLHPLMKEVYIIPFGQGDKRTWTTVLGINATRKLMAQRGAYSYRDDTPRIMTAEEQERIFGEVDKANIVAITKLRTKDGLEAQGYGRWPKDKAPQGMDKGNTKANMAFIRSERNAFGRLSPDVLPVGVEVIDDQFIDTPSGQVNTITGEVVVEDIPGEFEEVTESPPEATTESMTEVVEGKTGGNGQEERDKAAITSLEKLAKALKDDFGLSYQEQWDALGIADWNGLAIPLGKAYELVAKGMKSRS